jgi:Ca-activated chloride channel homolog
MSRLLQSFRAMVISVCMLSALPLSRAQQGPPEGLPAPQPERQENKAEDLSTRRPPQVKGAEGETIVKLSSDVVTLNVTVTDKHHNLVTGLEPQHFEVYEDKVMQKIEFFSSIDEPVSISIIFDTSESMKDKLDRARAALKAFIETSHKSDDFFLVPFNHRPNLIGRSVDGETAMQLLSEIEAGGSTALYDAAYLGVEEVKRGRHKKRALLIISDGQDNRSHYSSEELLRQLKESDVQVYCIGIVESFGDYVESSEERGSILLKKLAKTTGGKAFFPRINHELDDAVACIALELRRQYSIGYVPANFKRDGKWRKIKLRIKPPRDFPRLIIRTKEGYYAGN